MLHYIFFPSRPFSRGLSRLSLSPSPGLVALSGSLSRSLPASGSTSLAASRHCRRQHY